MIRKLLHRFTGVERDEVVPVFLMALYGFLGMTSYYLLKAPRNSIFVDRVGAENLPYIYILTAIFVTLVVLVYSRYVDRIGERTLLMGTFGVLAGGSALFWWLLLNDTSFWSSGAFYLWTKLYPLLLVSQFWLVGNLVFTTRQARRLFGPIGVGLIVGGIAGSAAAGTLAPIFGTEALAGVSAAVVVICALICASLFPRMGESRDTSGRLMDEVSGDAIKLLLRSGTLRTIAGILCLTVLVGTLLDWQLNRAVELNIQSEDAMTRFWGFFYMVLNITSVTIQIFLTGWVLRRFGVGVAILALPVGLLIATVGVLAVPVLLTAAIAKGAEGALRYSLDQSTREVLYLPVPTETKYKVKPLIDLAVYRGGTGLGGVILLIVVQWMGYGIQGVAAVALVAIAAWIVVAMRMRAEYMRSLADSIRRRVVSLDSAFVSLSEARVVDAVADALQTDDPVQQVFALDLVEESNPEDARRLSEQVTGLLSHPDRKVRRKALQVIVKVPETGEVEAVRARLQDEDREIREAAVRALCAVSDEPADLVVRDLLASEDADVRMAVLAVLGRGEVAADGSLVVGRSYLEERWDELESGGRELRKELALAAATLEDDPRAAEFLVPLIEDSDPEVSETALRSAGRVGSPELLDILVESLDLRTARSTARSALADAGAAAVPVLSDVLREEKDPVVRREAAHVLGRIPDQEAVGALMRTIEGGAGHWDVEREVIHALERLRHHHGDELMFDARLALMVSERQLEAAEHYDAACRTVVRDLVERDAAGGEPGALSPVEGLRFLASSIAWARNRRREGLFRCLGLAYPSAGMRRAYRTLTSGSQSAKSNAQEWLEHTLGRDRYQRLEPVLERADPEALESDLTGEDDGSADAGDGLAVPTRGGGLEGVLYGLWHDEDPAVRHAAVWVAARVGLEGVDRRLEVLARDGPTREIREMAAGLRERDGTGVDVEDRPLDPVERCLLLKSVDLLQEVSPDQLLELARLASEREVDAGERLVEAGEAGPGLHVLIRGRVELESPDEKREGGPSLSHRDGGAFGRWALIHGGPSPVGARATEPCRILEIRRDELLPVVAHQTELAEDLLRGFARRVRDGRAA